MRFSVSHHFRLFGHVRKAFGRQRSARIRNRRTVKSGRNLASVLLTAADTVDNMRLVYLHSQNGVLVL
jgi:hypothetical protein